MIKLNYSSSQEFVHLNHLIYKRDFSQQRDDKRDNLIINYMIDNPVVIITVVINNKIFSISFHEIYVKTVCWWLQCSTIQHLLFAIANNIQTASQTININNHNLYYIIHSLSFLFIIFIRLID